MLFLYKYQISGNHTQKHDIQVQYPQVKWIHQRKKKMGGGGGGGEGAGGEENKEPFHF